MRRLAFLMCVFLAGCALKVNVSVPPVLISSDSAQAKFDVKQAHKSVASVFSRAKKGVGEASGTAFAIDKDYLVTAGHVCIAFIQYQNTGLLEDTINLAIVKDGVKSEEAGVEIMEIDEPNDVCLMRRADHGLVPLEFVKNYDTDVKFGDIVWIVGAPPGYMVSWHNGNVMDTDSQKRFPIKGKLVVSVPAAHGNSGSPILNEAGKVVGILVMGDEDFDHLSICVKASTAQRFLKLVGWE